MPPYPFHIDGSGNMKEKTNILNSNVCFLWYFQPLFPIQSAFGDMGNHGL